MFYQALSCPLKFFCNLFMAQNVVKEIKSLESCDISKNAENLEIFSVFKWWAKIMI